MNNQIPYVVYYQDPQSDGAQFVAAFKFRWDAKQFCANCHNGFDIYKYGQFWS